MFETLGRGAVAGGHVVEALVEHGGLAERAEAFLLHRIGRGAQRRAHAGVVAFNLLQISAGGDALHGGHHLQLARALVDGKDARVAVEALARILFHEAAAAMHLDAVVGALVGVLAGVELDQRGEDVGDAGGRDRLRLYEQL